MDFRVWKVTSSFGAGGAGRAGVASSMFLRYGFGAPRFGDPFVYHYLVTLPPIEPFQQLPSVRFRIEQKSRVEIPHLVV